MEVITSQSKYNSVNEILAYSVNNGKFYVVYDYNTKRDNCVGIYSVEYDGYLSTQKEVDDFGKNVKNLTFNKSVFYKASSDITVDDQTYSKDGIEGDNPFARQCGVENAWMTYVSDFKGQTFYSTSTGYGRVCTILTINTENYLDIGEFVVESNYSYSDDDLYKNLVTNNKREIIDVQEVYLGKNLSSQLS